MIKLNSRWSIDSDSMCVTILEHAVSKKTGKPYFSGRWYYPNFKSALEGLIDRDVQSLSKLEYMVERIDELKADISALALVLDDKRNTSGRDSNESNG